MALYTVSNNWTRLCTKFPDERYVFDYLITSFVKSHGYLFENDETIVSHNDVFVQDQYFQRVYCAMHERISELNMGFKFKNSLTGLSDVFSNPSHRCVLFLNECIVMRWTYHTITKFLQIPLAFFILVRGRCDLVRYMVDQILFLGSKLDLDVYQEYSLFYSEFFCFVNDIVHIPEPRYPKVTYRYLRFAKGDCDASLFIL